MRKNNSIVRYALFSNDVRQWELAELLNVSEMTIIRKLRKELSEEEQKRLAALIEKYAKERDAKQ